MIDLLEIIVLVGATAGLLAVIGGLAIWFVHWFEPPAQWTKGDRRPLPPPVQITVVQADGQPAITYYYQGDR